MQKSKYYSLTKVQNKYKLQIKRVPIPLYRYRTFNEFSLSDLINEELSFSTPDTFNDPYDSVAILDENITKNICDELFIKTGLNIEKSFVDKIIVLVAKLMKNSAGIASLSERINSEIMWAHYANLGKGFALEYDYDSLKYISGAYEKGQRILYQNPAVDTSFFNLAHFESVGPVIYVNKKLNITETLMEAIKYSLDNMGNKNNQQVIIEYLKKQGTEKIKSLNETIFYLKNKDWQYEKEWRVVVSMPKYEIGSGYFSVHGIKAKALFLGEFIDRKCENILREIAANKNIKVYQMKTVTTKSGMKLSVKSRK